MRKNFRPFLWKNRKGQGLIEYLVLVALMGIASIAIVRALNQTITARLASVTYALQGKKKSVAMDTVEESYHEKKDLSNFFNGVGDGSSED